MPFCAPSAIRTRALLLRSNPAGDGVANSDDAGHVRGGPRCCRPSYLVIRVSGTVPDERETAKATPAREAPAWNHSAQWNELTGVIRAIYRGMLAIITSFPEVM